MSRKLISKDLVIASHNLGKIEEISFLLKPFSINAVSSKSMNLLSPKETAKTYLENALIKARACADRTDWPVLADDSGIEVEALGGAPGVDTAPFTKNFGGREKVFAHWQRLSEIKHNPKAAFICVLVLLWPDGHYECFEGIVRGRLTFPARGSGGHGYDPIFIADGQEQTMGQMPFDKKQSCSHRFVALQKLIDACIK